MKFISVVLIVLFLVGFAAAQPKFDNADFSRKFETVRWLADYDEVAWKTSDIVMKGTEAEIKRLGREWFCFEDADGTWHAVYGKYTKPDFDLVFHFTYDKNGKIERTTAKVDAAMLGSYATALMTATAKVESIIGKESPGFNQFIRRNADKTFDVWLLPAFQSNGMAVYGGEFSYKLDAAGEKITADESYYQGKFRAFQTGNPREIWLDYKDVKKPTLGGIFFVWYYKSYFTKIYLETAESTSTLFNDEKTGYLWLNVDKDKKK